MPNRPIFAAVLLLCGCRDGTPIERPVPSAAPSPASGPWIYPGCNLVFISLDALQAKHVGHLGYARDTTPTLDSVAKDGYTFTRASSVASWTVPASMTWFTGVYPSEHRMTNKFALYQPPVRKRASLKELAPNLGTLAEVLKQKGYATAGFTGNAGVSRGFGYEQGFDAYVHDEGVFGGLDASVPRALKWLRANKDQPFFLFLHGYDAHGQNTPADGYDYRYVDPSYDKRYTGSEREQEALREEGLEKGRLHLRESDVRFWRAVYDEKVCRADDRLREFLAEYDKLGLTDRTLFVITSDHGTELFEHGRIDHGFALHEELLHVPLVIKLPKGSASGRVADRISSIDLLPTILELMAVDPPGGFVRQMRGKSLVPAMKGEAVARDLFAETDYREFTFKRSILAPDGWKLIVTLETGTRELYDLGRDPHETNDLAIADSQRADALQRRLFAHYKAIGHDLESRSWRRGLNPVYQSQGR